MATSSIFASVHITDEAGAQALWNAYRDAQNRPARPFDLEAVTPKPADLEKLKGLFERANS